MGIPADPGSLGQSGSRAGAQNDCEYTQPHGIKPAPERNRKTNWKEFLNRHWEQIVASDFFTVEVWTPKGLKRYIVSLLHRAIHTTRGYREESRIRRIDYG